MPKLIFTAAALALVGSAPALAAEDKAVWSINGTSWEVTDGSRTFQETVDEKGNYVITAGTQHIDHGTIVMKDGKVCATSAMTQDGEFCWTVPALEVGASGEAVSDRGNKVMVKRVAYVPPAQ